MRFLPYPEVVGFARRYQIKILRSLTELISTLIADGHQCKSRYVFWAKLVWRHCKIVFAQNSTTLFLCVPPSLPRFELRFRSKRHAKDRAVGFPEDAPSLQDRIEPISVVEYLFHSSFSTTYLRIPFQGMHVRHMRRESANFAAIISNSRATMICASVRRLISIWRPFFGKLLAHRGKNFRLKQAVTVKLIRRKQVPITSVRAFLQ
jgi:hypothetical protein